jgi:hypothetical protein
MISRRLSFLAMVALFCMVFIELTQTTPLNKRQEDGYSGAVAYADFEDGIGGRYTFASNPDDGLSARGYEADHVSTRYYGLFTRGFNKDRNIKNYEFYIVTKKGRKINLTKDFRNTVTIYPAGGTTPFQKDLKGEANSVNEIVYGKFVVKHKGEKVIEAPIKHLY